MQEKIGMLPVVRTVAALRRAVAQWRHADDVVALVPTMGALHRGHLTLLAHGKALADRVVASVFVNPTQFGPNEDFGRYPRDLAGDAAKLAGAQCDLLYAPDATEMYPDGFVTTVSAGPLAEPLDGRFRPGHFGGVATVVTKLLLQARPDIACFGEKDYQQLQIIRRVARDLDIETRIEGVPTVREEDGLALSSRNAYLSPEERRIAPSLQRTLAAVAQRVAAGTPPPEAASWGAAELTHAGFTKLDYLEICDAETLTPLVARERPGRVLAAAWLGKTRLIDNLALAPRGSG
jgi:pantoate--beta-alanine ligase